MSTFFCRRFFGDQSYYFFFTPACSSQNYGLIFYFAYNVNLWHFWRDPRSGRGNKFTVVLPKPTSTIFWRQFVIRKMNSRDKIVDINDIKQKPILPFTRIPNCTVGNTGEDIFRTASSYLQFFYCNKYVKCEIHLALPWKTTMHIAPHSIYVQISVTNVNDFKRTKISGWRTLYLRLVVSSPNASQIFWCLKNYGRSRLFRKVPFQNQCCQLLTI